MEKPLDIDSLQTDFFNHIYNFEFSDSEKTLNKLMHSDIDQNTKHFYLSNYYWWKIVSGDKTKNYTKLCESNLNSIIKNLENKKNKSNTDLFNYVMAYAFITRLNLLEKKPLKSISYLNKTLESLSQCLKKQNEDERLLFLSGMYYYFVDYARKKYPVLYPYLLFFPKGKREKGLKILQKCTNTDNEIIKTESNYFLMKIYFHTEKNAQKAIKHCYKLIKKHPSNLVYLYEYYQILKKLNETLRINKQIQIIEHQAKNNSQLNTYQKQHFINLLKQKK